MQMAFIDYASTAGYGGDKWVDFDKESIQYWLCKDDYSRKNHGVMLKQSYDDDNIDLSGDLSDTEDEFQENDTYVILRMDPKSYHYSDFITHYPNWMVNNTDREWELFPNHNFDKVIEKATELVTEL